MPEDRASLLTALTRSCDEIIACYAFDRATLVRSYAPGKWTARHLLVHICDADTVLLDRLRRLAADEKPLLWAYDENRWAAHLGYEGRSLPVTRDLFAASRRAAIDLIGVLPEESFQRTGVHSEAGTKTFVQVAQMMATHGEHHLEQLRAIAQGRPWPAR